MSLSVNNLKFKYKSEYVLEDVSFSVKKGECLAILGTNGTGKSTLLKCLNRILKAENGKVFIENTDISTLNRIELAKQIVYVSQQNKSYRSTVFDTILLGRKPYIKWDVTKKDLDIVNNTMKMLKLQHLSLKYTDELSGGQLQKVLIARALVQDPKVLMLDEPTSSLDLKNQLEVIKIVKKITKDKQIASVVTMHDLNLALRFADKFMFLKDGKVFSFGGIEIMTSENIEKVYSVPVKIEKYNDMPIVIPL
ncbi:ABC transporter ATP-binding protein [Clostridium botulinum]|nr:ABC transporter ATP-binding protein [Clostridium botulinum]